jgi:hypothetical protein
MELAKALETIKAVCDDAVGTGKLKSMDEAAHVSECFNFIVSACNYAAQKRQQEQAAADAAAQEQQSQPQPTQPQPTQA